MYATLLLFVILDSLDQPSALSHLLISSPSRTSKSGKCSRNFLAIVDFPEQGRPVIQIIKLIKNLLLCTFISVTIHPIPGSGSNQKHHYINKNLKKLIDD
jgi:hypothetical protein